MFDHSLQVRQLAKQKAVKAFFTENKSKFPMQISTKTALRKDEFWPNIFNPKWRYGPQGKLKEGDTLTGCLFLVNVDFYFDTTATGKYTVNTNVIISDPVIPI